MSTTTHVVSPAIRHANFRLAKGRLIADAQRTIELLNRTIINAISEEHVRSTAFLFVPVFLGTGAVLYFSGESEPTTKSLLLAFFLLAIARALLRKMPAIALCFNAMLLVSTGALLSKAETARHTQTMLGSELTTTVVGRIRSTEQTATGLRIVLDVEQTLAPTLKYAPAGIRFSARGEQPPMRAGNQIQARIRLAPPSGPVRPGGYDFAFEAWFDDIGATGFANGKITVLNPPTSDAPTLGERLERLRQIIAGRVRSTIGGEEGAVAAALIAGVQAGISRETAEAMRLSGLSHVLSISGLHMALVAALFMVGLRGAMALFPNRAARMPTRKIAAAIALLACLFYLALSGAGVATVRSFIMIAVMLGAVLIDRPALTMRNLAIAALLIIIVTPHEVMGPSFQMSFSATAALISAYGIFAGRQPKRASSTQSGWPKRTLSALWRVVAAAALTSLVAGLATALYSAWHFHRLAPMGLPANLAAMMPVSVLIMPSAVAAVLLMPFGLDSIPLAIMGKGVSMMIAIADYCAALSPDSATGALHPAALPLGTIALLLVIGLQTRLRWIAAIPVAAATICIAIGTPPDVMISEDGRMVAVRITNDGYAINQLRPNKFTREVWQRALGTDNFVPPELKTSGNRNVQSESNAAFVCIDNACRITTRTGQNIAWLDYPKLQLPERKVTVDAANAPAVEPLPGANLSDLLKLDRGANDAISTLAFEALAEELCAQADLLILNGPVRRNFCTNKNVTVITALDLALNGAAEIRMGAINDDLHSIAKQNKLSNTMILYDIHYAVGGPNRPWNRERIYSRAARSMPPFRPIPRPKPRDDNGVSTETLTQNQRGERTQNSFPKAASTTSNPVAAGQPVTEQSPDAHHTNSAKNNPMTRQTPKTPQDAAPDTSSSLSTEVPDAELANGNTATETTDQ